MMRMARVFSITTATLVLAGVGFPGFARAEVVLTVSDAVPNGQPGGSGSGNRTLSTTLGSVSAPAALPTMTYTVSNLDLTSVGGGVSETIAYDIAFTQTGGTGVQFNTFGNISVTGGGNDNFIQPGQTLTANVTLNTGLTTFSGGITLGFLQFQAGGASAGETWDVVYDGGTINAGGNPITNNPAEFPAPSPFFTVQNVANTSDGVNVQQYSVQITAVPEPTIVTLLAAGAFVGLVVLGRRRCHVGPPR